MSSCELYPQFTLDQMRRFWIAKYCEADYSPCARLKLVEQGRPVSPTLLPNGRDLAGAIPSS
jgi:hypothetical protein